MEDVSCISVEFWGITEEKEVLLSGDVFGSVVTDGKQLSNSGYLITFVRTNRQTFGDVLRSYFSEQKPSCLSNLQVPANVIHHIEADKENENDRDTEIHINSLISNSMIGKSFKVFFYPQKSCLVKNGKNPV
jgi:hypothetical protein